MLVDQCLAKSPPERLLLAAVGSRCRNETQRQTLSEGQRPLGNRRRKDYRKQKGEGN